MLHVLVLQLVNGRFAPCILTPESEPQTRALERGTGLEREWLLELFGRQGRLDWAAD